MPHDIFISYANEDLTAGEHICAHLEAAAVRCWMAPRDIPPGASYPASIVSAIAGARVLVLVLSSHSSGSPHVRSEIERAFNRGLPIIPFRIDSAELSPDLQYFLSTVQWLDAQEGPIDTHLEQLTNAVRDALQGVTPAPCRAGVRLSRRWMWVSAGALLALGVVGYVYLSSRQPPASLTTTAAQPAGSAQPTHVPPEEKKPAPPEVEPSTEWVNPKEGQKYVRIPPGRFLMGCSATDSECDEDEKPAHWVTIAKEFWLGQTEVTVEAFRRYARKSGQPPPEGDGRLPVTGIDWSSAKAYCAAVGGRLPAESEWEYAARGGRSEARYDALNRIAWYNDNSGDTPHPVAQKEPNAFGLYDMLGNVSEWVLDRYYDKYYEEPEQPGHVEEPLAGNASGVLRGGSWAHDRKAARASNRFGVPPDLADGFAGLRCACDRR